jgi:hypothetical protein
MFALSLALLVSSPTRRDARNEAIGYVRVSSEEHMDSGRGPLELSICYNLRFPMLFRLLALGRGRLIALASEFTECTGRDHREVLIEEAVCHEPQTNSRRRWRCLPAQLHPIHLVEQPQYHKSQESHGVFGPERTFPINVHMEVLPQRADIPHLPVLWVHLNHAVKAGFPESRPGRDEFE